jgi:hypothetical protein
MDFTNAKPGSQATAGDKLLMRSAHFSRFSALCAVAFNHAVRMLLPLQKNHIEQLNSLGTFAD